MRGDSTTHKFGFTGCHNGRGSDLVEAMDDAKTTSRPRDDDDDSDLDTNG